MALFQAALIFLRRASIWGAVFLLAVPALGKPAVPARSAGGGRITAVFSGLQGRTGYLRVSLFGRADSFPDGAPVARRDISLQAPGAPSGPLSVTFDKLRPGVYAVCAFHDRSGSGKLTQDALGIPLEEWGMSGNPHPQFRAPRFQEAKINLGPQEQEIVFITLHT